MQLKTALLCLVLAAGSPMAAADWPSFGRDPQRSGSSPEETDLNPRNARAMTLLWKSHLDNQPREMNALTAAVSVEWVVTDQGMKEIVVVGGASENLFALDAGTGKVLWKKTFSIEGKPHEEPFWLCPNALNATPLIRKEDLKASAYAIASDGLGNLEVPVELIDGRKLRGLVEQHLDAKRLDYLAQFRGFGL